MAPNPATGRSAERNWGNQLGLGISKTMSNDSVPRNGEIRRSSTNRPILPWMPYKVRLSLLDSRIAVILGWILAGWLGVSISHSQFPPFELDRIEREEQNQIEEIEADRLRQSLLAEHRARAHERLAVSGEVALFQSTCPYSTESTAESGLIPRKRTGTPEPRYRVRPSGAVWQGVAKAGESAGSLFGDHVSDQIVQSRCIYCHVPGGASGHTRLVFAPADVEGHEATNLGVFQGFLDTVKGGADLILHKIQGAGGHGGGVQVVSGSAEFANMERFLRALGGETTSGGLSPQTLFEGVTMSTPEKTLRRAALLFAGRLPTRQEYAAVRGRGEAALRPAIRGLMVGQGFHDFLIREANDRLLTDREIGNVIGVTEVRFVDLANRRWELAQEGIRNGFAENPRRYPPFRLHERAVQYGMARAPLELIAHVVENDLPYTEIMTADYIMANPVAAKAYGAATEFEDDSNATEFKPAEILRYFRRNRSMKVEEQPPGVWRVLEPGHLSTEYPHAGILNTTAFLRRYPTTATNRNRARSRWTYYHFLGFDIEKSAARTQDPEALADTNNPTMYNPACTVCHIPMDPVAGTFQNYGNLGLYRDKNGGMDALPALYRSPKDGSATPYVRGDTWFRDMRDPGFSGMVAPSNKNSVQWLAKQIAADERFAEAAVRFWWPAVMGVELADPPGDRTDPGFEALLVTSSAQALEVAALAQAFRAGFGAGSPYNAKDLLTEMVLSPWFRAESTVSDDAGRTIALQAAGVARLLTPEELVSKTDAITGYVWGRRFQQPFGLNEPISRLSNPRGFSGYELLYGGIDSEGITERTGDITPLMAAVAQSHAVEVSCPIVRREFYYWPDHQRRLFNGITKFDTPVAETSGSFDVVAASWGERQTIAMDLALAPGQKTVRLAFTNNLDGGLPGSQGEVLDRNLALDSLALRHSSGAVVLAVELEGFGRKRCGRPQDGFFWMRGNCYLDVHASVPHAGSYTLEVVAHQDRAGNEPARLEITVEAEDGSSQGELAIRRKLADLHQKLLGVAVAIDSPDVNEAYDLFVETWNRKRASEGGMFGNSRFNCRETADHLYFDGIVEDALAFNENGFSQPDMARIREFKTGLQLPDPRHAARAWVVTLAYLLADYRYLYF